MIKDELKKLGEYAEELQKEEPFDLLYNYTYKITEELEKLPEYQSNLGNEFSKKIINIVNEYVNKDLNSSTISYQLLSVLVSFIKKSMIEEKAISLGINSNLYKKEMKFLFKGTWK
jgi:hypothetical protein